MDTSPVFSLANFPEFVCVSSAGWTGFSVSWFEEPSTVPSFGFTGTSSTVYSEFSYL